MTLNKKNWDGSVNSYQDTGLPGHGYFVPFNDLNFEEQVEEHIFPVVLYLTAQGYVTVTSCQGHSLYSYLLGKSIRWNSGPQVTVIVEPVCVPEFKKKFSNHIFTVDENIVEVFGHGDKIGLSIRPRLWANFIFTNKSLCIKMLLLCLKEKL